MAIKVPLTYADFTLGQLVVLHQEDDMMKRLEACSNLDSEALRKLSLKEMREADAHLRVIQEQEYGKHLKVITLDGVDYGFIPDWNEFSLGEWIDMEEYAKDFWNNATKIASLLYRPVTRQWKDKYKIEPYTSKEDPEPFNELSADLWAGMLLFFSNSRRKLQHTLKSSLMEVAKNQLSSLSSGATTPSSTSYQKKTSSRWRMLLSLVSSSCSRIWRSFKTSRT